MYDQKLWQRLIDRMHEALDDATIPFDEKAKETLVELEINLKK